MRMVLTTYRAADWCRVQVRRNRYYVGSPDQQTIGLGVQVGRKVLSLQWREPRAARV